MATPNRRKNDMTAVEAAYRKGLRRRASDSEERSMYYWLLFLVAGAYALIGVGSYLWR